MNTAHPPTGSGESHRFDAAGFEVAAADRVAHIGVTDLEAFRASFDVIRLSTRLVQVLESRVHRPAGWSMAGFRVMFVVWVAGGLEPREIAHLSGLSRAAVSSVLNTLERDGLVRRSRESDDRRLVTVRVTPDGEARLVTAYRAQNELEYGLFGEIPDRELASFLRTLRRVLSTPVPGDDSILDDLDPDD